MVEAYYPHNLIEALKLKKSHPKARLYAGGTDLMAVRNTLKELLFINHIEELKEVTEDDTYISIGAGCNYYDLFGMDVVPELLKQAIGGIASPAIRNVATMGGNICNASPAGDSIPVLYLLDAKIVAVSLDTDDQIVERVIPIEEFITGIRKLSLREDEIVKEIRIPKESLSKDSRTYYKKVGARKSEAISKLSFVAKMDCKDGIITDLRIAYGSIGITVLRDRGIEQSCIGRKTDELPQIAKELKETYGERIHPIDDQRSTAKYRKTVCLNLLQDFLLG